MGTLKAYIQCFKFRIVLNGKDFPCPYHPFAVGIQTPFRVLNMEHQVITVEEVKLTGEVEPLSTFSQEDSNGFREYAHQAIIQMNEKNKESLQPKLKVSGEATFTRGS